MDTTSPSWNASRADRALEAGLAALVILAPLPFGAVSASGRLALEVSSFALLFFWACLGWTRRLHLPPKRILGLLAALLLFGVVQILPLGEALITAVSPGASAVRESVASNGQALTAEERLLQMAPSELDAPPTLSVEPGATASALRTGAALCALLIIATHVTATCGVRRLATALLFSAALQALYGLIVLASGYDRIWTAEKTAYLDSATGTWVNRNHFADYLAMALPCGAALWVVGLNETATRGKTWLLRTFSSEGSRNLLRLLALLIGTAGLLVSLSRAGIALGVAGITATLWLGTRSRPATTRVVLIVLALAIALVPLGQLGADALWDRLESSADDLTSPGRRGTVWLDTLDLARDFPAVGSGFGTFAAIYPRFRSSDVRFFYAYAHNDPLQFLAEGGVLGGLMLLALLWALVRPLLAALRGEYGPLPIGIAVGMSAALLHSLIDFNFHLPANAAVAAVLAGSLWGLRSANAN